MKKIFLIDGMSLVFRAYHALFTSQLKNSEGSPTGAIFGFANIITSFLEKEAPEYAAVVFDRPEPTFRHIMYKEYKANRDACPDDLVPQIPKIKELVEYMGLPSFELAGYEADDVIGTISKQMSDQGYEVFCVTSDKDYYQLVNDKVKIYKPQSKGADFQIVDYNEVNEKFGVTPDKVIDVLALIGDASDNVPGVKGIGEKTAIPLIQTYGSLENLYENIENLDKKAVKEKLATNKEMAFLSKKLVTIDTAVPLVNNSYEDLKIRTIDFSNLKEFLKANNLRALLEKWMKKAVAQDSLHIGEPLERPETVEEEPVVKIVENINTIKKDYILVGKNNFDRVFEELEKAEILAFDLETDSLDRPSCQIVGISLCAQEGRAFYIPIAPDGASNVKINESLSLFDEPEVIKDNNDERNLNINDVVLKLKPILENTKIQKCGQNAKFDAFILRRYDIIVTPIAFDTMVADYLINPDNRHNLDDMSVRWLNYEPVHIGSLIGEKKSKQITMREVDIDLVKDYAAEDADLALKLRNRLLGELQKSGHWDLAINMEFPIVEVLTQMEYEGVAINVPALKEISENIDVQVKELTQNIYAEAGIEFNIDSPKQLTHILYEKMGITPTKKTKTGFSTDVQALTDLAPIYPIANMILSYRQLMKLKSTYVEALPKLISTKTGRIHTTYNQTVVSTGRLSSTDPNLQNIPIRSEMGKEIRKAFCAGEKDCKIFAADYSQIELRIIAYYSGDENLINAFKSGLDIHTATAAKLFSLNLEEVTSDHRRTAKTVNFGLLYGLGSFGLSQRLGISRNAAKDIIENYFEKYPGIKKYITDTIAKCEANGYVETLCGRRRYFADINSKNKNLKSAAERAAINMPIQGSASDMMKIAMINIRKKFDELNLKSKMIMQVHDELVFEVRSDELEIVSRIVPELMCAALPLGEVPVLVETGVGENWLEAH